jgi:flagellar protein FliL
MADKEEEIVDDKNEASESKEGKGGINMTVVLIAVAVVALLLAIGGAFFMVKALSGSGQSAAGSAEKTGKQEAAVSEEQHSVGVLYSFEKAVIVNLAETNAERYLKLEITLELENAKIRKEIETRLPQVQDLLISVTSTKTLEDVSTTSGRNMLRQEMIDKINSLLTAGRVLNIYFTEFVVQ